MATTTTTTMGRPTPASKKALYWGIAIGVIVLAAILWAFNRRNMATTESTVTDPATMSVPAETTTGGYNNGTTSSGESMQGTGTEVQGGYNNGTPNTDPVQPNNAPVQ